MTEDKDNKISPGDDGRENIDWHSGFVHAMRLYLRKYEEHLEFEDEFQLTRKPLRIDLTIVRKQGDARIDNNIGCFFKKHNLLEYKSPDTKLNLTTFFKVIAYACLYISLPSNQTGDGKPIDTQDVTITLVRASYPRGLIEDLRRHGYKVTVSDRSKNIYYVDGAIFPIQIVVTRPSNEPGENESDMIWLNAMSPISGKRHLTNLYR